MTPPLSPEQPYPRITDELARLQREFASLHKDRDVIEWHIIELEKRIKYLQDLEAMNETYVVPH